MRGGSTIRNPNCSPVLTVCSPPLPWPAEDRLTGASGLRAKGFPLLGGATRCLKVMVANNQKIDVVRTGQKRGEAVQREFSTNPSKWASVCNDLVDVPQVGGAHPNGKYLKLISREGRNFPGPALLEQKGSPGRLVRRAGCWSSWRRSADAAAVHCCCGLQKHATGLCWHLQSGYSLP